MFNPKFPSWPTENNYVALSRTYDKLVRLEVGLSDDERKGFMRRAVWILEEGLRRGDLDTFCAETNLVPLYKKYGVCRRRKAFFKEMYKETGNQDYLKLMR